MKYVHKVILTDIFTTRKDEILPSLRYLSQGLANKNVVLFDISQNAICPDGCQELVPLLLANPSIMYLYLNHVALSEKGSRVIAQAIKDSGMDLIVF